jgi:hypothetical protein
MSEIVAAVALEPGLDLERRLDSLDLRTLELEIVHASDSIPCKACYFTALWKRIGEEHRALGVCLLGRIDGYLTSALFVPFPDGGYARGHVTFPEEYRAEFEAVLSLAMQASTAGKLLFFSEPTYYLSDDKTLPEDRYERFDVAGPITLEELFRMHDRDELREQRIYIVEGR